MESSNPLSPKDLRFMKKLGFAIGFIEIAKINGCFKFEGLSINWNLACNKRSDFFFEITRNSFPIGMDTQKNYIYISNITLESSKVGLLNPKTLQYVTVANSLEEFFENCEKILPYDFPIISEGQEFFKDGDSVRINIHSSNVGDVDCFLPFGTNTRGRITPRSGEYVAVYKDPTSIKRRVFIRDQMAWIGLIVISVTYFLICRRLEVRFSTQLSIYLVVLFGLGPVMMFWQRLSGNWHRL